MGMFFSVAQANFVAYLTHPTDDIHPPRVSGGLLQRFLDTLIGGQGIITTNTGWHSHLSRVANDARRQLNHYRGFSDEKLVSEDTVIGTLQELRTLFRSFAFVALCLPTKETEREYHAFTEWGARKSGPIGLFLMPQVQYEEERVLVVDPFPILAAVARNPQAIPGVAMWTKSGKVGIGKPAEVAKVLFEIRPTIWGMESGVASVISEGQTRIDMAVSGLKEHLRDSKTLVHLSDLHFGGNSGPLGKRRLINHLIDAHLSNKPELVATGDLLNNPTRRSAEEFEDFRLEIERDFRVKLRVVPGNHDQKWWGNSYGRVGREVSQLLQIYWRPVEVCHESKVTFLSFDSSRHADFANGHVDAKQMSNVSTELSNEIDRNPDMADYLRISLVHHHPISFSSPQETFLQRALGMLGSDDERFLSMEGGEAFLEWCGEKGVSIILHGHKHVARHAYTSVKSARGYRTIAAIGCGTSLGAEGMPLSYNVIRWNPSARKWAVTFMKEWGGTGVFREEVVSLSFH